ncbi:putative ankyrin repeat protein RF_0381 [Liolophura sinensis]|uniref:putative ankyrin repeat protein RF_0381 n=1 Tax=Liolophura sinensis TaxID=3198878 RepID=UPI0031595323
MSEESTNLRDPETRSLLADLYQLVCARPMEDKEFVQDHLLNHKHLLDEDIGFWCDSSQSWCQAGPKFEFYPTHELGCVDAKFSSCHTAAFVECIRQGNCSCKQNSRLSSRSFGKEIWVGVRLIHLAVRLREAWLVEFLLDHGCHPNPTTPLNKLRPLYIAARVGYPDIVQQLLARGATIFKEDLPTPDECGRTQDDKNNLLHHALSLIALDALPLDEKRMQQSLTFKLLVRSGIWDVDHRDCNGETVLMSAVESEMVEEVEVLLDANADPNLLCDAGFCPLFRAVDRGNYAISSALIEAGADVNYAVCNKVTLLQAAVEDGFSKIAELLLQNGADPNFVPSGSPHPLIMAICDRDSKCVDALIKHGADVNARREDGVTALHLAAFYGGSEESIHLLLKHGADPHARDIRQSTPIHFATYSGNVAGVLELLKFNANPEVFNCIRASPLWYAVAMQRGCIVQTLLEQKVTMETSSSGDEPGSEYIGKIYPSEKSVLWVAVERSCPQVVKMLLKAGYNIWQEHWLVEGNTEGFDKDGSMEIFRELQDAVKEMPSLLCLCRFFFRSRFGPKLRIIAEEFLLPQTLKDFLR